MIVLEVSPEQLGDYHVNDGYKQDEIKSETKVGTADESKDQVDGETEEHIKGEYKEKDIDREYKEEDLYDDRNDDEDFKTQTSEEQTKVEEPVKEEIDQQIIKKKRWLMISTSAYISLDVIKT